MLGIFKQKPVIDEVQIDELLTRGVEEVIEKKHLKIRLLSGEKLRVKLGIDPTAKDLHLGHTVVLRKLKQFQNLGHQIILIIGDFTATIGDPSGRNELRPQLSREQIQANLQNYLSQAGKVINIKNTEVHYNSEWYSKKGIVFLFELTSKFTIARQLERDDFQKRIKEERDISVTEILYPLLQGYDSVEVKADVELGGTDQKFNLLTGRRVQKRFGLTEQDIMTTPLLEGLDGVRKMSKSLGNYIGLSDSSTDMFGKIMSIPDDLMVKYFELLTEVGEVEIEQLRNDRLHPSLATKNPKQWKEKLAQEIVKIYHGEKEAETAEENFENTFSKGGVPEDMIEINVTRETFMSDILIAQNLITSKSEFRRLISEGAITNTDNGEKITNPEMKVSSGTYKIGKRRFIKLKVL